MATNSGAAPTPPPAAITTISDNGPASALTSTTGATATSDIVIPPRAATSDIVIPPPPLRNIWECKMITKCTVTKKGVDKEGWNCAWCGEDFVPVHATRAVTHVLKIRNEGIAICKAAIPDENREPYLELRTEGTAKGAARKRAREINEDVIMESVGGERANGSNEDGGSQCFFRIIKLAWICHHKTICVEEDFFCC